MAYKNPERYKVIVEVVEVRGECAFYKVGDKIVLDEPAFVCDESHSSKPKGMGNCICFALAANIYPWIHSLTRGLDPYDLDISKKRGVGYIGCHGMELGDAPDSHGMIIVKTTQIPTKESISDRFYVDLARNGKPGHGAASKKARGL